MVTGIFGRKRSGKTTLAKELAKVIWRTQRRYAIVLDPNNDRWEANAMVYTQPEAFLEAFERSRSCEAIIDEAAITINRARDFMGCFTQGHHYGHNTTVIGHSGADLLPGMRNQFDRLFLFRQPASAAEVWRDIFANDGVLRCATLGQYEFLDVDLFRDPIVRKLTL